MRWRVSKHATCAGHADGGEAEGVDDDLVVDPETGEVLDCASLPASATEGESRQHWCLSYHAESHLAFDVRL